MPIRAILFDKDGTLVDFQRTWGPATHEVLTQLCNGDSAAFERLAAVSLYDPAQRKLLPGSPVVIETTYGYGKLWAQALGVPLTQAFVDQIDRMFFQTTLDHLTPMGDVKALLTSFRARGLRLGLMTNDADANTRAQLQKLGLDGLLEFVAAYDFGYRPQARSRSGAGVRQVRRRRAGRDRGGRRHRARSCGGARRGRGRGRRAERAGSTRAAGAPCGRAFALDRETHGLAFQYCRQGLSFGLDGRAQAPKNPA